MKYGSNCFKIRERLTNLGCGLAYNINVHAELIKLTRFELIEHFITELDNTKKNKPILNLYSKYEQRKLTQAKFIKFLIESNFNFVQNILGNEGVNLKSEVQSALTGCTYWGTKEGMKASWDDAYKVIGSTCLDSSDAMILNIVAHNENFAGLITADYDFQYANKFKPPRDFFVWISKV